MNFEGNKYKRIPKTHVFGIYKGIDNESRISLFVKLAKKPKYNTSNKYLIFECNKRTDGLWAFIISISEPKYNGVFNKLVLDLVDTVVGIDNALSAERAFMRRFTEWKTLFEKEVTGMLGFSEIIGLAGELHFLKQFMFDKYGVTDSLHAWSGPIGADKDFIINDTWYEIKTKSFKKDIVHLNSHTQLVSKNIGYLTVVPFEKSSQADPNSVNLFDLYTSISESIENQDLQADFDLKLARLNFVPDERYRQVSIIFHEIEFYTVDKTFPQISNLNFKDIILNIEYNLFLPGLKQYRVEG